MCLTLKMFFFALFFEYTFFFFARRVEYFILLFKSKGKLYLTYDDGPSFEFQQKLLDLLKRNNVKATFFLNAKKAENLLEKCLEISGHGHEIGFHGYEHINDLKISQIKSIKYIGKSKEILKFSSDFCRCYRFPYGKFKFSSWLVVILSRSIPVHWTVDSGDTKKNKNFDGVLREVSRNRGGVVLMHSFDRTDDHRTEEYVLNITEELIEWARSNNIQILKCSELYKR